MDPATAGAAAYGLETAVEAGVATYFLTQPTLPLKAQLQHISSPISNPVTRSGHSLSVISDKAYIFGGVNSSNEESANNIEEIKISTDDNDQVSTSLKTITAIGENGQVPAPRMKHSATIARQRVFIFGGCPPSESSSAPAPLQENGRIWIFDPLAPGGVNWLFLDPPPHTSFPVSRYAHSSTATEDGSAIFIHGGISSESGERLNDTWAFYLDEGKWSQMGDAPGKGRSGAGLACCKGRLWRFGGEDQDGVVGNLDYLVLPEGGHSIRQAGTLDDSKREWIVVDSPALTGEKEKDEANWPVARSGAAMHYITTGNSRDYLVLALGSPGEGKLLQDIWAYQLPTPALSAAGMKDVIKDKTPMVDSHEGQWAQVVITKMEVGENEKTPGVWTGRSGFGCCVTGTKQFILWGGKDEYGSVLGDGWWVKIQ